VEIRIDLDEELPPLRVDPNQIRQVLLNIVLNGIQSMPEGGILELTSCSEKELIVIHIADRGEGVAAEDLEKIFDPFFTTKSEGTGLGLSIAHQLVEIHGGRITATRNDHGGMTFSIELPLT